ncbi:MAG: phage portal protein [Synergistaceae bacterium]|nr:phage portal protein [Synergistaceae bacterium]
MNVVNSGYSEHGANRRKPSLIKWITSSKSPHEDISENLELLRERSRDLYAGGSGLGRGAVERVVLNALGPGLRLNVRIDPTRLGMTEGEAGEFASEVEARFDYWASSREADYSRELTFYELQVLALRSILLDGECLMLMPTRGRRLCVQLLESERLCSPLGYAGVNVLDEGVEVDVLTGSPIAYWVTNRNPNSEYLRQPRIEYTRIPAFLPDGTRNVYHLFPRERIGQHRGVPFLAPVIEQLKQLGRYTDAELMAAVVSGVFAIFFEHEPREDGVYGEEDYASDSGVGEDPLAGYPNMQEMTGTMMDLPEGVKATSLSPGRPNQNFGQFVEALVNQVGGALGIPSELLLQRFTSSYSASRGALLEAWKVFKYWRKWFADNFCQSVYEAWFSQEVEGGRIAAPKYGLDDYHGKLYTWCEWIGPSQGQLDPVKEVNAAVNRIEHNLSTYQREAGELTGEDWDLVVSALTRERKKIQGR